jgi:hypothetical protein
LPSEAHPEGPSILTVCAISTTAVIASIPSVAC